MEEKSSTQKPQNKMRALTGAQVFDKTFFIGQKIIKQCKKTIY